MPLKIPTRLLGLVFSRVFRAPKDVTAQVLPQLTSAVGAVSKLGAKRLKEFLAALPIFVLFVRELLRRRAEVGAKKQLAIVGAAAGLSTLVLVAIGSLLGSLPMQLVLVVTHPWVGIPLFMSTGLVVTTVMVLLVWLIVYVLNLTMADDPTYCKIRDEFIPPTTRELLLAVQQEVEESGADLEALKNVVEERLMARGSTADANRLEKELERIEQRLNRNASKRLTDAADRLENSNGPGSVEA